MAGVYLYNGKGEGKPGWVELNQMRRDVGKIQKSGRAS